jgi:Rod binding domain-containing protein
MVEAARQFEAIFLRQLLSGLEKAGELGGGAVTSGSGIYGSMMVGALAESAASGGGIGLSELVLRALTPPPSKQP